MKLSRWVSWCAGMALIGSSCVGTFLRANDEPAKADDKPAQEAKEETKTAVRVIAIPALGKHWIGVHATPINDEALRSHLDLKGDRLIVVQVVPESPAAKAGVKQHDILVKFGDKELTKVDDLIKVVNDNGDKEAKLLVLRAGKNLTMEVKPTERPADPKIARIHEILPQDLRVWVEGGEKGEGDEKGNFTFRMLGPGIATARGFGHGHGGAAFPNGLSLSVTKENEQPAKIVAKKDGKTYETTGDKLGELPEDIRQHVERLLHAPHAMAFSLSDLKKFPVDGAKIQLEVQKAVEAAKKQAEELRSRHEGDAKAVRSRVEVRRGDGGPIDELRKEIEALRKEVQKLKDSDKDDSKNESDNKSS